MLKGSNLGIPELELNGKVYTSDKEKAEVLGSYFQSVYTEEETRSLELTAYRLRSERNSESLNSESLTNKGKMILYTYSLAETQLDWVDSYQYLGVIINSKLKWGEHCPSVAVKATQVLNLLRQCMGVERKWRRGYTKPLSDCTLSIVAQCGHHTHKQTMTQLRKSRRGQQDGLTLGGTAQLRNGVGATMSPWLNFIGQPLNKDILTNHSVKYIR